jgi:hypothetical protein
VVSVTLRILAGYVPKSTSVAPANPVPLIVTGVPPATGPVAVERPVNIGPPYVNWSAATTALVPNGPITRTSLIPVATCPEEVTVIWVSVTLRILAGYVPKSTSVAPANPVPLIVTGVPPNTPPVAGERPVNIGPPYVNWSAGTIALVPPGAITRTSWIPVATCPEEVTVIWVSETVRILAGYVPKSTSDVPANPVPLIVTGVPPNTPPVAGERPVTLGAATYVYWSDEEVADVVHVVTVTSTVPSEPAGAVAVIIVSLTTVTPVAAVEPKVTVGVP